MMANKRRQPTFFKINAERWMTSSTRIELKVEERAVWVDVLAMGALYGGVVEIPSKVSIKGGKPKPDFKLFASSMLLNETLVEHCFNLFQTSGKLQQTYDKPERKFYYKITKWELYQSEYLWGENEKKPPKKAIQENDKKRGGSFDQIRLDEIRREKRRGEDLPPIPKNIDFEYKDKLQKIGVQVMELREKLERLEKKKESLSEEKDKIELNNLQNMIEDTKRHITQGEKEYYGLHDKLKKLGS